MIDAFCCLGLFFASMFALVFSAAKEGVNWRGIVGTGVVWLEKRLLD
jgi:hypothetical protein